MEQAKIDMSKEMPSRDDLIKQAEEQVAAEAAAAEEATKAEEVAAQPPRPEWLPEKFKSVEDMAKAYGELEKKVSGGKPEEKAAKEDLQVPSAEEISKSSLDMDALQAEWDANGSLSAEAYEQAEKAGYSKEIVDRYIEGQQAIVERQVSEVYAAVGGVDAYANLLEWAGNNLSEAEVDTFNGIIASNDLNSIMLAVKGLEARASASGAVEPARQIEGGTAGTSDVFESQAQWMEAMRDPRYRKDPAYNRAVMEKLSRSNI